MRISIYSSNYAPEPTGIPYFNTLMAEWLARTTGWTVTVHTGIPHYPWWRVPDAYAHKDFRDGRADELRNGVHVERVAHYVPQAPVTGAKRMRLDASYVWAVFRRSLRARVRPDVVMIISPPFLGGLLGLFLSWRWRVPVVYHVQDLQIDAALDLGMIGRPLARVLMAIERVIINNVDLLTTVSDGMSHRIAQKTAGRRTPISFPNWADVESMRTHQGVNRFREEWGVKEGEVIILYSGNLGRKQGLEILIKAFGLLAQHTGIHCVIAGAGADADALREHVRSVQLARLRIVPLVDERNLVEFLSAADIHCIPQRRVVADLVMPSKLLNIMAVSRPVIATADPGTELYRVIERAGCGVCSPPEQPENLATALAHLALDPVLCKRMGNAGRIYCEAHLSTNRVLGRFAQRLNSLIHPRHVGGIVDSSANPHVQHTNHHPIGVAG
jgi:colanic acid biosynthesis glycosyl transferase WcaI